MDKIKKAIELLKPINYKPFDTAYYVTKDERDMGNSDYCENCINEQVKIDKDYHLKKRAEIIDKYNQIEKYGYFKIGRKKIQVKGKYSDYKIKQSKRHELKDYRLKSIFSYEGHDPDFGGGLHKPCSCENCGEYFTCNFEPDKDEAEDLLDILKNNESISDCIRWELDIALFNYQYIKDDNTKKIMTKVAELIINKMQ